MIRGLAVGLLVQDSNKQHPNIAYIPGCNLETTIPKLLVE
jgi:hypothetical protein